MTLALLALVRAAKSTQTPFQICQNRVTQFDSFVYWRALAGNVRERNQARMSEGTFQGLTFLRANQDYIPKNPTMDWGELAEAGIYRPDPVHLGTADDWDSHNSDREAGPGEDGGGASGGAGAGAGPGAGPGAEAGHL